jgi:hypothetical protein
MGHETIRGGEDGQIHEGDRRDRGISDVSSLIEEDTITTVSNATSSLSCIGVRRQYDMNSKGTGQLWCGNLYVAKEALVMITVAGFLTAYPGMQKRTVHSARGIWNGAGATGRARCRNGRLGA